MDLGSRGLSLCFGSVKLGTASRSDASWGSPKKIGAGSTNQPVECSTVAKVQKTVARLYVYDPEGNVKGRFDANPSAFVRHPSKFRARRRDKT